jgi:hypothetical protein
MWIVEFIFIFTSRRAGGENKGAMKIVYLAVARIQAFRYILMKSKIFKEIAPKIPSALDGQESYIYLNKSTSDLCLPINTT